MSINPHIRDEHSPLRTLIAQALRRFGDFAPSSIDADTALMFIEFANMVIDEVRAHPYAEHLADVAYYGSLDDARPIPDPIMLAGLLYHYSMQQNSEKVQLFMPSFFKTMNMVLYQKLQGNGPIEMRPVDGGPAGRTVAGRGRPA